MKTKQLNETFSMTVDGKPVKSFKKIDEKVKSFLGENITKPGVKDFWNRAISHFEEIATAHPDVKDFELLAYEKDDEYGPILDVFAKGLYPNMIRQITIYSVRIDKKGETGTAVYTDRFGQRSLDVITTVKR